MTSLEFQCGAVCFLLFPHVVYWICEIEFSHMGNKSENPDLVCKKISFHVGLNFCASTTSDSRA